MLHTIKQRLGWFDSSTLASRVSYVAFLGWIVWTTTYLFPRAEAVAAFALAAMVFDSVMRGRLPPGGGAIGRWLLVLLAALVVTTGSSIWLGRSVAEVVEFAKWMSFFYLALYCLTSVRRLKVAVGLTILCLALYPALGSIRAFSAGAVKFAGRAEWQGFFGNPNALSASLVLFMPLAVVLWRRAERTWLQGLWGGSVLLMLVAILRSGSRSGFLALIVVLVWTVWSSRDRLRALAVAGLGVLALLATAPEDMRDRLATVGYRMSGQTVPSAQSQAAGSTESRLEIWKTGMQVFLDHPLVGTGPGTFGEAHTRYQESEFQGWTGSRARRDAHNAFVRMAAETGLLGLLPFVVLFVVTYRMGMRDARRLEYRSAGNSELAQLLRAALVGLSAFLVSNLFNTFVNLWLLYMVLGVIAVIGTLGRRQVPRDISIRMGRSRPRRARYAGR